MSDRIYTIPAREVVAGMLYHTSDQQWQRVLVARRVNNRVRIAHDGPGVIAVHADCTLPIGLPGPSPRKPLCSCHRSPNVPPTTVEPLRVLPWVEHDDDCPVRRLRLRLWPVGARWDEDLRCYQLDADVGYPQKIRCYVSGYAIAENFAGYDLPLRDHVRAAFCEPEVTRCYDCNAETDAGPCPGCNRVFCQRCAEGDGPVDRVMCCDGEGGEVQP